MAAALKHRSYSDSECESQLSSQMCGPSIDEEQEEEVSTLEKGDTLKLQLEALPYESLDSVSITAESVSMFDESLSMTDVSLSMTDVSVSMTDVSLSMTDVSLSMTDASLIRHASTD